MLQKTTGCGHTRAHIQASETEPTWFLKPNTSMFKNRSSVPLLVCAVDKTKRQLLCSSLRQWISTQWVMARYITWRACQKYTCFGSPHSQTLIQDMHEVLKVPQVIPICHTLIFLFLVNTIFATPVKCRQAFKYSGQVKMTPPSYSPGSRWIFVIELHYMWTYSSKPIFYSRHLTMSFLTFLLTG